MKKQTNDWMLRADQDLQAAEILLQGDFPLTNIVAFHCQQAVEKYLKAYLTENNVPLVKTHDLIKLCGMAEEIQDLGIDEAKLIIINEVYLDSRYPAELGLIADGMPTTKQAKEFVESAKEIQKIITASV
jgi:HEPN domain-containing protein